MAQNASLDDDPDESKNATAEIKKQYTLNSHTNSGDKIREEQYKKMKNVYMKHCQIQQKGSHMTKHIHMETLYVTFFIYCNIHDFLSSL